MSRIYIGNLSWSATDETLRNLLAQDGRTVTQVMIKKNATSGKPRGFAFVDMGSQAEAEAAIAKLNGAMFDGRALKVSMAKELTNRVSQLRDFGASSGYSGTTRNRRGGSRY
jgi:RNA recognition motif-containing protein